MSNNTDALREIILEAYRAGLTGHSSELAIAKGTIDYLTAKAEQKLIRREAAALLDETTAIQVATDAPLYYQYDDGSRVPLRIRREQLKYRLTKQSPIPVSKEQESHRE